MRVLERFRESFATTVDIPSFRAFLGHRKEATIDLEIRDGEEMRTIFGKSEIHITYRLS